MDLVSCPKDAEGVDSVSDRSFHKVSEHQDRSDTCLIKDADTELVTEGPRRTMRSWHKIFMFSIYFYRF